MDKDRTPLEKVTKDGDLLCKQVDKVSKERLKRAYNIKSKDIDVKLKSILQSCYELKPQITKLLQRAEELSEENEGTKVKNFDRKKIKEKDRITAWQTQVDYAMAILLLSEEGATYLKKDFHEINKELSLAGGNDKICFKRKQLEQAQEIWNCKKEVNTVKKTEKEKKEDDGDEEVENEEEEDIDDVEDDGDEEVEDEEEEDDEVEEEEIEEEDYVDENEKEKGELKVTNSVQLFEAICDFTSIEKGDLNFKAGEVLTIISTREDGWWEAENEKGETGSVPSTYFKINNKHKDVQQTDEEEDDESKGETEDDDEESEEEMTLIKPRRKAKKTKSKKEEDTVKKTEEEEKQEDDEKVEEEDNDDEEDDGDEEVEEEEIKEEDDEEEEDDDDDDDDESEMEKKKLKVTNSGRLFEAICDFTSIEKGDLNFKAGEVLTIITTREDGWWEAENEKGEKGCVPSTYFKIYNKHKDVQQTDEEEDDEDNEDDDEESEEEVTLLEPWRKARKTKSKKEVKTVKKTEEEEKEEEDDGDEEDEEIDDEEVELEVEEEDDDDGDGDDDESEKEQGDLEGTTTGRLFEAICDFTSIEKDDLNIKAGEVLTIICTREDGWCEAENEKGEKGSVPSTYLKVSVPSTYLKTYDKYKDVQQADKEEYSKDKEENEDDEDEEDDDDKDGDQVTLLKQWKQRRKAKTSKIVSDEEKASTPYKSSYLEQNLAPAAFDCDLEESELTPVEGPYSKDDEQCLREQAGLEDGMSFCYGENAAFHFMYNYMNKVLSFEEMAQFRGTGLGIGRQMPGEECNLTYSFTFPGK